jgi:glycosyltransferase involved in cell wall biosynthesis
MAAIGKSLLVTYDLMPAKCRLMPWRTIVEVARHFPDFGVDAGILSIGEDDGQIDVPGLPAPVRAVRRDRAELLQPIEELCGGALPDVVFWPLTWRQPCWRIKRIHRLGIPIVGYFSGGAYCWKEAVYAARRIGIKAALPYLIEAASWKRLKARCFDENGVEAIITMTQLTADVVQRAGWPESRLFSSYPGRDDGATKADGHAGDLPPWAKDRVGSDPFFLYAGPPSAVRGVFELLDAFDLAAISNPNFSLVCLFRDDPHLDQGAVRQKISRLRHSKRVIAAWKSVDPETLGIFYGHCHAVILPFLIVPSEIPLVFIELLEWRKPVITTAGGGTGKFAGRFGLRVPVGDITGLSQAMLRLLGDAELYVRLRKRSADVLDGHPSWRSVASSWNDAAVCAAGSRSAELR